MRQFFAAIRKEFLLLIRDKIGLGILFIMPMTLIFVMTLIQDAVFRTLNEEGLPIIVVNNDNNALGNGIVEGLKGSDMCTFYDSLDGKLAGPEDVKRAVKEGKFLVGVIIPEGATDAIEKNVEDLVAESLGMEEENGGEIVQTEIRIIIDPVASKSFVVSITSRLREFISSVKTKIMFESFNEQIAELIPDDTDVQKKEYGGKEVVLYKEEFASELTGEIKPNAVQHNVPAWTIFSMFFIVLPLVSSIMKEKEEGTVFRFHTMPTPYILQINAKIVVFISVCMIQFILMMSIGLWVMPFMGLPPLNLGNSYTGILVIALGCAIAATGYGVLVGTLAESQQQGSILGSLSILILSALGGIWVPTYVMPEIMRGISEFSPLSWGLDGFYGLFLRGEGLYDVFPNFIKLLIFFVICLAASMYIQRIKKTR